LRMNSPATNRVGNGGCPGPRRQTELKRITYRIFRTFRESGFF
jgi:hypothetical protein